MARDTVIEEEMIGDQKIYRTENGWHIAGLRRASRPLDRDEAAAIAELLDESRLLAELNLGLVERGVKPIPPRRVTDANLRQAKTWPDVPAKLSDRNVKRPS